MVGAVEGACAQRGGRYEEGLVLAGDYNIIPRAEDVYNPAAWAEDALFQPEFRAGIPAHPQSGPYRRAMACDSRAGPIHLLGLSGRRLAEGPGPRIDHILLSPQALARLKAVGIDRKPRGWDKPSDHTPVTAVL